MSTLSGIGTFGLETKVDLPPQLFLTLPLQTAAS